MDTTRFPKQLEQERQLLLKRMFLLNLFDDLYKTDPNPFYDEDRDEIVEPYCSMLAPYADVADTKLFAETIMRIHQAEDTNEPLPDLVKCDSIQDHHQNCEPS